MREIKFRAWDKRKKEWIRDFDVSGSFGNVIVEGVVNQQTGTTGSWLHPEAILMEYTGLKDKNGKDIYECDILKFSDISDKIIITFEDGSFGYQYFGFKKIYDISQTTIKDFEVIGNIWEHPELLEAK